MTTWIKQDGTEIHLNDEDATIEAAVANGWTTEKAKPAKAKKEKKSEEPAED